MNIPNFIISCKPLILQLLLWQIKVAVYATCGIYKRQKIQNGRQIQTQIYNRVEMLDDCHI